MNYNLAKHLIGKIRFTELKLPRIRIRIRIKMKRIHNTDLKGAQTFKTLDKPLEEAGLWK